MTNYVKTAATFDRLSDKGSEGRKRNSDKLQNVKIRELRQEAEVDVNGSEND